ncbi:MAG: Hpt domain-containing protein [Oscillospiraceae bacterium]|jgi:HPt (histidine-containing phosphotransfer) domain-containing protein|nr:Hpt domain-containing protein [Oscillospiraceae bacterium]
MGFDKNVYIDAEDGAKRVGGNMALYKKLLTRFAESNYLESLTAELGSGDIEGAANMAHTIKGVSANLSLTKVNEISAALESALKNGKPHEDLYAELKTAADATIKEISSLQ